MADVKISALTTLATPDPLDYAPVVDVSTMTTKKVLLSGVMQTFNVKNYGATGNGTTNDYAAIAAACAAAAAAGGGTVYFPAGIYLSSSTLTLPDHVNIQGDGGIDPATDATFDGSWLKGTFVHASYNHIADIKLGSGSSSCTSGTSGTAVYTTFERVRFRSNSAGATYIINPTDSTGTCNNITWTDCIFEANGVVNGDTVSVLVPSIAANRTCDDMHFIRCIFSAWNGTYSGSRGFDMEIVSHYGPSTTVTVVTKGWLFDGCIFEANSYTSGVTWGGLSLSGNPGADSESMFVDGRVINCTFRGNPRYGVALEGGAFGWLIANNTFYHHGGGGIQCWGTTNGGHVISGNIFDSYTPNGVTATTAYMMTLRGTNGTTITGNTFLPGSQNATYAIQIERNLDRPDSGRHNVISGNLFNDRRTTSGVPFINFGGGDSNLVTGNYFKSRRADGRVIYSTHAASVGNVVTGNYFNNGAGTEDPFYVTAGELIHYGNYYTSVSNVGVLDPVFASTAQPSTMAEEGAMYYNSTDHKLYVRTNSAWVVVGSQS